LLTNSTRARILRGEGAQTNSFENIGLFACAVVAANMAGVDAFYLNALSAGYVLIRFIYNHVYIFNDNAALATARSVTYALGSACWITLYVMAGRRLNSRTLI